MKQKIINEKNYTKQCSNCFYGRTTKDRTEVLCEKKGIVSPDYKCRHYRYDPLKRVPNKTVIDTNYTAEDFKL